MKGRERLGAVRAFTYVVCHIAYDPADQSAHGRVVIYD